MHAGDAGELELEMGERARGGFFFAQESEGALQEREELRFIVIGLGADLDQLDEVGRDLHARVAGADAGEGIREHDFAQGVQIGFPAAHESDLGFVEEIELARERALRAARAFGHGAHGAERARAPGDDEAGVAELAFAEQNRVRAFHAGRL